MTSRIIESEQERKMLIRFIEGHKLPMTVNVSAGRKRTVDQNKLQRLWVNEIAEQLGDQTAEDVRGFCKLHFGVPIMRAESDEFCEVYDRLIRPRPYEEKIELMKVPLDLPVTRIMTTRQKTAYLDAIHKHFTEQGIVLTDPGDLLKVGERIAA